MHQPCEAGQQKLKFWRPLSPTQYERATKFCVVTMPVQGKVRPFRNAVNPMARRQHPSFWDPLHMLLSSDMENQITCRGEGKKLQLVGLKPHPRSPTLEDYCFVESTCILKSTIVAFVYMFFVHVITLLLLACAKNHMLSARLRQPHLLHVSAVDRRQTWSMDKS